jgi:hypothetical protein
MNRTPLRRQVNIIHPHIQPDEDNPNFRCGACEVKYTTGSAYR